MTPDDLAAKGRALHGERWQTALAQDLSVTDRTLRRWVAGESAIPATVDAKLQGLLAKRLSELGGMVAYTVNLASHRIVHRPTNACFAYDAAGNLDLLNPNVVAPEVRAVIELGASEFVRGVREPQVEFQWLDRAGPTPDPIESDPTARRKLIDEIRAAARAKVLPGPDAAHAADFLYGDDGLPK